MRYKFIALPPLVFLLSALTLASCGSGSSPSSTQETTGSIEEATKVAPSQGPEGGDNKATSRPSRGEESIKDPGKLSPPVFSGFDFEIKEGVF